MLINYVSYCSTSVFSNCASFKIQDIFVLLVSPNFAKNIIKGKTKADVSKVKQIIDMTEETLDFVNYSKKQGTVLEGMSDICATFVF